MNKTVYMHVGHDGEPLYIGCTKNLKARTSNHRYRSEWWPQVADVRALGEWPEDEALAKEAELIAEHQPRFNMKHSDRQLREAAEAGRQLAREHKAQGYRLSPEQVDAAARILAAAARERMREVA